MEERIDGVPQHPLAKAYLAKHTFSWLPGKRNIYIAMLAHCAGNLIGATLSLVGFLGGS